jgi:hypothetical protein
LKNLLILGPDLDPELDPDPHLSKSLDPDPHIIINANPNPISRSRAPIALLALTIINCWQIALKHAELPIPALRHNVKQALPAYVRIGHAYGNQLFNFACQSSHYLL